MHQFVLPAPKNERSQERWLVGEFSDETFSLYAVTAHDGKTWRTGCLADGLPYGKLWETLDDDDLRIGKWWLIGNRIAYALHKADFTGALDRGEIRLPLINTGKNKGKIGGKLTLSKFVTEVDIECGKNRIKILDFNNFGLSSSPSQFAQRPSSATWFPDVLVNWLKQENCLGVSVSKSTSAQNGWAHCRSRCMSRPMYANIDPAARALERAAYFGGRNECFRLGEIPGTTYSLDVKSCYATICRDERLPVRLIESYPAGLPVEGIAPKGDSHWFAEVVLDTTTADHPLQWGGTTIYPVGQFRTALPWPELQRALLSGRVLRVLHAARYEADYVLREYAQWYLDARESLRSGKLHGNDSWLKAMFNSSLGYSARQKYDWVPWDTELGYPYWIGIAPSPECEGEVVQAQKLGDERRWLRVAGEPRESVPYLHATICSYARVRLLEIFESADRKNVMYCDTDGILVNQAGARKLLDCRIGPGVFTHGLVTRFPAGSARIQGQKVYRIGDEWVQAGVARTRYSKFVEKNVYTTPTGSVGTDGVVSPFVFSCEDTGDEKENWRNRQV